MYSKILAIGAHPDDVELGCAGTLLKFKAMGADVDIVVARDDNAPKPSVRRDSEQMQNEYRASEAVVMPDDWILQDVENIGWLGDLFDLDVNFSGSLSLE